MLLSEIYEYYGRKWSKVAIELKVTESTVSYWRKKQYICFRTQLLIEHRTNGIFTASEDHGRKEVAAA
jgi:hypothetical protein